MIKQVWFLWERVAKLNISCKENLATESGFLAGEERVKARCYIKEIPIS